ncbi:GNAT family N-acetyltransferase [Staphylococcus arlettae]|uniref:GNAT family N-acetyltransferase n=1 Tax=Staphylococcus TaxID=1279 RepID=UPI00178C2E6E|nr:MULTISPECIES: GNAT family N-acetyltransferase [Staphylococcus]MCD8888650.1 GNAT family N-acetyltransferase [Staphylococcus arlettae]MEB7422145.1 GNAT family N-acetyltransferase [Staphylococcus arlettae]
MKQLTTKDKSLINQMAKIQESELAQAAKQPSPSAFKIALREEMIIHRLKYSRDMILCIAHEEQMAAFIWGHFDEATTSVTIEMIYVVETYRHQGIATKLKQQIEQWAISTGALSIQGTVDITNEAMQKLNEYLGYHTQKVIMTKSLQSKHEDKKE